ncbi:MAG: hypothetical protein WKF78_07635 [Candidatus Limnocylindrales bacterium]
MIPTALEPTLCRRPQRPCTLGPNVYGIGGDGLLRLFVTLQYPDGDHLFALGLGGSSAADFRAFAVLTQPILDSIRVPDRYVGFHQTVPEQLDLTVGFGRGERI